MPYVQLDRAYGGKLIHRVEDTREMNFIGLTCALILDHLADR